MFFHQVVLGGASGKAWGGCAYVISLLLGVGGGEMSKSEMSKIYNAPAGNRTRGPTMATLDFTTKPLALNLVINIYIQILNINNLLPFKYSSTTFQSLDLLGFSPTLYLCDTEEPDIPTWTFIHIKRERHIVLFH